MYAVFAERSIIYLGDDREEAMRSLESKEGSTLKTVSTLANLNAAFSSYLNSTSEDAEAEAIPDPVNRVLERLDELGFNEDNAETIMKRLREDSDRAVAEVKSLGIRGMNAVGEGFVALGELLRQADQQVEQEEGSEEEEAS